MAIKNFGICSHMDPCLGLMSLTPFGYQVEGEKGEGEVCELLFPLF